MNSINPEKVTGIKNALKALEELAIPEHLQAAAFQYLLAGSQPSVVGGGRAVTVHHTAELPSATRGLREYVGALSLKTAVVEIPSLLYWAKNNEGTETVDEKGLIELYRRAGLRPPKNITQSLRDLASKKYGRLESVSGQPGYVKLSRVGEDFVIHDVIEKSRK